MCRKLTVVIVLFLLFLPSVACIPTKTQSANLDSLGDKNISNTETGISYAYKGGYGIGSKKVYTFENPILFEGNRINLPYWISLTGDTSIRLMLFVDGASQKFKIDQVTDLVRFSKKSTDWVNELIDTGQVEQNIDLIFEPNLGQSEEYLCMVPLGLVKVGYPDKLNPTGLGEYQKVVAQPQPLLMTIDTLATDKLESHSIEYLEDEDTMDVEEKATNVSVYTEESPAGPNLIINDGKLNLHVRLNNVAYAYRVTVFINGEPVLLDGLPNVLIEPSKENVILQYNLDVSDVPEDSEVFAVAVPVGQPCMRSVSLAHISSIKTIKKK